MRIKASRIESISLVIQMFEFAQGAGLSILGYKVVGPPPSYSAVTASFSGRKYLKYAASFDEGA
jgi:hypothetical protein